MLENVFVVNRYCKLEKNKTRKEKKLLKKETCKHVIKSDLLIRFCMAMSSTFCTDEPGRQ